MKLNLKNIPAPREYQTCRIPLNVPLTRQELSEICSIFEQAQCEHCQLTVQIDGIDHDFLFGNMCSTQAHTWVQPLHFMFEAPTGDFGLSPVIH